MSKKPIKPQAKPKAIKPQDNKANMKNRNIGVRGQNPQVAKNEGNRGKQLNPNNPSPAKKKVKK